MGIIKSHMVWSMLYSGFLMKSFKTKKSDGCSYDGFRYDKLQKVQVYVWSFVWEWRHLGFMDEIENEDNGA